MKKNYLFLVMSFFCLIISTNSYACKMRSDHSWNWSYDQLKNNSTDVCLVETVSIVNAKQKGEVRQKWHEYDYKFRVVKVIKGSRNAGDIVELNRYSSPSEVGVLKSEAPRARLGKDCEPIVGFELDRKYVLYLDKLNPFSFQQH
jgi:hypothetical protein